MFQPHLKRSEITGIGGYLPENVVTNHDFAKRMDTSHEWIVERTGIHQRHFAGEGEFTSDLCVKAAERALDQAGLTAEELDYIIVGTTTPDRTFPSTATIVQRKLGNRKALGFDVAGVCAGFLVALNVANNFLRVGQGKYALVIGAECLTKMLDMEDRSTCVLFGDGAGAVVLEGKELENPKVDSGIIGVHLQSDGRFNDILTADGGPSSTGSVGRLRMDGQEVYKHAVTKLFDSAKTTLDHYNLTGEDIDWFIPHQANLRIISSVAERLNMSSDKVITTVQKHANTSAASIPLAMWVAQSEGRLKKGDLILHEAIGGGLVWGSALVRY